MDIKNTNMLAVVTIFNSLLLLAIIAFGAYYFLPRSSAPTAQSTQPMPDVATQKAMESNKELARHPAQFSARIVAISGNTISFDTVQIFSPNIDNVAPTKVEGSITSATIFGKIVGASKQYDPNAPDGGLIIQDVPRSTFVAGIDVSNVKGTWSGDTFTVTRLLITSAPASPAQ